MAGIADEESGVGRTEEGILSMQSSQSGEALAEWRSSEQVEKGTPSTSPPYWDTDDDDEDDDGGPKPSDLFGKHKWEIEKFSQINKRELRSSIFDAGGYKWYILIYPQGCDVCNHLSLFLCVANHDKLLPGWSHFAQFTIAVVNKDPKKSKYSDTLHRFWKKEHDWGWKKFMELSKVYDGFIDADTLIIKAQVQVIREKADRPFRCLDSQYRRELLRVYLSNVEQICRRFVEEKRGELGKLIEDKSRWSSFCTFWLGIDQNARRHMSKEKMDVILKVVVKHFFIEKEVTSTLVMDSLYSGLKALQSQSKCKKARVKSSDVDDLPAPIVSLDQDMFVLADDALILLERAAMEPLPPKDEKGPQNRTKDGNSGEDFNRDTIERDERRLTELGRRTVEIFVLGHIFSNNIEVAYQEAVALKRQEELIREEEEAWLAESEQRAKRGANLKEKKLKKKQTKQKRLNRKLKDKERDERLSAASQGENQDENIVEEKDIIAPDHEQLSVEKPEAAEDVSDTSDHQDGVREVLQHDSDDRDASPVNWDTDASEVHPSVDAGGIAVGSNSPVQNGLSEKRNPSVMDDSSSTCSTDSVPSVVTGLTTKGSSFSSNSKNHHSSGREKSQRIKETREAIRQSRMENDSAGPATDLLESHADPAGPATDILEPQREQTRRAEVHVIKKDEAVIPQKETVVREQANEEKSVKEKPTAGQPSSSPVAYTKSILPLKAEQRSNSAIEISPSRKGHLNGQPRNDVSSSATSSSLVNLASKTESSKDVTKSVPSQVSGLSRPSSAPLVPAIRAPASQVPVFSTSPSLSRSMSAIVRLTPETPTSSHSYVPLSYRNAIIGTSAASTSSSMFAHPSSPSSVGKAASYIPSQSLPTSQVMLPPSNEGVDYNAVRSRFPYGVVGRESAQNGPSRWLEGIDIRSAQNDTPRQSDARSTDYFRSSFRSRNDCSDIQAGTSGRLSNGYTSDDFPHMDIIKELLDDEHATGRFGRMTSAPFQSYGGRPPLLSRHSSFSYDIPGISGNLDSPPPSSFEAVHHPRGFRPNGVHHRYGFPSSFDSASGFTPQVSSLSNTNGQGDGLISNQWHIPGSELSGLGMKSPDGNSYPLYSNYLTCGVNGYPSFWPPNGH
ncbi:hypothetical protein MLD38_027282 [Melastoma candidum]|uniref:Uncharacterized protein n=1 Tax=Melastoma candidum TaxID=119954 RepID=A0ACB9P265_9MYRT|nr:hypothetical protein MLD38_027282 [Melastoma candidum]